MNLGKAKVTFYKLDKQMIHYLIKARSSNKIRQFINSFKKIKMNK